MKTYLPDLESCKVAVIGLGYVGLPLAIEIAKTKQCHRTKKNINRTVIGFDINKNRLAELEKNIDRTNEVSSENLSCSKIFFTNKFENLLEADIFIITVPTPIDSANKPDLSCLKDATNLVADIIKEKAKFNKKIHPIVIYESTVFPLATDDICIKIIEKKSSLTINKDFSCGFSPERINPGDKMRKISDIVKVTSGSNKQAADWIDLFYGSFIKAGTYKATSIAVAEAAKIIENTQRDLNIALINELSIMFREMNIDIYDVLDAASTKWNFLNFKPGLVGGHCIGVDPYYLTYKSEQVGYYPELVTAGRRINDGMSKWVVNQLIIKMAKNGMLISGTELLILGITFKENCPDLRNSKVLDIINESRKYGLLPNIVDPLADKKEAKDKYNIDLSNEISFDKKYKVIILCVKHQFFVEMPKEKWNKLMSEDAIIFDLKNTLPRDLNPERL